VLSEVSAIYCEDTRHSSKLLQHFEINKPLIPCHEHNEAQRAVEIANRVLAGESIAYLSDAGMPCISDPGARIVQTAINMQVPYTVLPGATAFTTALAISGLDSSAFAFFGFLDRSGKQRKNILQKIIDSEITSIIYESPNRIYATIADIAKFDPARSVCIVREITKIYEERIEGEAEQLKNRFEAENIKGECVLLISKKEKQEADKTQIISRIEELLEQHSTKKVAEIVANEFSINKNEAYKLTLEIKQD
jgi:16S rRNA (cytidine1402-2'-O)-methyltransferase